MDTPFIPPEVHAAVAEVAIAPHPEPPHELLIQGTLSHPPYPGDCGLDLLTATDVTIPEGHTRNIPCGVRVALPPNHFGWIVARSSTWTTWGLMVIPGVIDEGFRGPLYTLVYRPVRVPIPPRDGYIPAGTRLAQLILLPNVISRVRLTHVPPTAGFPPSTRGERGFGSSGI